MSEIFLLVNGIILGMGFYCATKLNGDWPCIIRLVILCPVFVSCYAIHAVLVKNAPIYLHDILERLSMYLIYSLIVARFSSRPWRRDPWRELSSPT